MRGPIAAGCQGGSGTRTLWHGRLGSQCLGHQTCAWSSPFYTASMALHHLDEAEVPVVTDLAHLHVAMLKSHVLSPSRRLTPRGGDKLMPGRQGTTLDVMIDRILPRSPSSPQKPLSGCLATFAIRCPGFVRAYGVHCSIRRGKSPRRPTLIETDAVRHALAG